MTTQTTTAAARLEQLLEAARSGENVTAAQLTKARAEVELEALAQEAERRAAAEAAAAQLANDQNALRAEFPALDDHLAAVQTSADAARLAMLDYIAAVRAYDQLNENLERQARRLGIEAELPKPIGRRWSTNPADDLAVIAQDAAGERRHEKVRPQSGGRDGSHRHVVFSRQWFDSGARVEAEQPLLAELNAEADRKAAERVEERAAKERLRRERIESGEVVESGGVLLSPEAADARAKATGAFRRQARRSQPL